MKESDLEDFHSYRSNAEICKFQSFDAFTIEDSKEFIDKVKDLEFGTPGEWVQIGMEWKENGKLVGDLALCPAKDEPRNVEIGVTLNLNYRGKGFAIEAFKGVFEYLFTETETHRIFGILDTENHGSRKLMENLNFRREAHFVKSFWDEGFNEWRDEYVYAMLKEDWERDLTAKTKESEGKEINIKLTETEAIVLFEFLSRFSDKEILEIEDKSEERVLWDTQCVLEKKLSDSFSENYAEILKDAREKLK